MIDTSQCKACWECIDACSKKVFGKIAIFSHRHAVIKRAELCIGCGKCIKVCKNAAISANPESRLHSILEKDN